MQTLKAAVEAGALGRIALIAVESVNYRPQSYYDSPWRGTIALDGGVLMTQAIHEIDLALWLGGPVTSVAAHTATLGHVMEAPDTATVSLRFANGTLATVLATTCAVPGFEQEVRIYGDAGHVRIVSEVPVEWEVPGFPVPATSPDDPATDRRRPRRGHLGHGLRRPHAPVPGPGRGDPRGSPAGHHRRGRPARHRGGPRRPRVGADRPDRDARRRRRWGSDRLADPQLAAEGGAHLRRSSGRTIRWHDPMT